MASPAAIILEPLTNDQILDRAGQVNGNLRAKLGHWIVTPTTTLASRHRRIAIIVRLVHT